MRLTIAIRMDEDRAPGIRGFRHEALLYSDSDDFLTEVADFVTDGLVRGEPAVIAVSRDKIQALGAALGDEKGVCFVDMDEAGRNPACLIPAYHDFIAAEGANRPCRGVGEPIGPARRGPELVECEIHESLCNLAFTKTSWWVLCPYDTATLDQAVIDEACRNHPVLLEKGKRRTSPAYRARTPTGPLGQPLPEPPEQARRIELLASSLRDLPEHLSDQWSAVGLDPDRVSDLLLAVDEIVAGSIDDITAGGGTLAIWVEGSSAITDVRHRGRLTDPLVGRHPPTREGGRGRGLGRANQLCDLVQVRSDPSGTTVRLHMRIGQ